MFLVPLFALLTVAASSQAEPAPEPVATELVRALRDASKKTGVHVRGTASERAPEDDGASGAIVIGVGLGGAKFSGEFDAWRTADDELFVLSQRRLPELALYDDGVQPIVRTTCADVTFDPAQVAADLTALLDLGELAESVESLAKGADTRKVERSGGPGEPGRFACALPARMIRSTGGVAQMALPKVLRIEAGFTLDATGALAAMRFVVVRSDPFSAIRRSALSGATPGGVAIDASSVGGDEEGPSSVYELALDAQAPDERAQAVLESLRAAAASDVR